MNRKFIATYYIPLFNFCAHAHTCMHLQAQIHTHTRIFLPFLILFNFCVCRMFSCLPAVSLRNDQFYALLFCCNLFMLTLNRILLGLYFTQHPIYNLNHSLYLLRFEENDWNSLCTQTHMLAWKYTNTYTNTYTHMQACTDPTKKKFFLKIGV